MISALSDLHVFRIIFQITKQNAFNEHDFNTRKN